MHREASPLEIERGHCDATKMSGGEEAPGATNCHEDRKTYPDCRHAVAFPRSTIVRPGTKRDEKNSGPL